MTPQLVGKDVTVDVLANDFDPDDPEGTLTVSLPDDVAGVRVSGGKLQVHLGQRSMAFVYEIADADGGTARAVVHIPVFDSLPPMANPDSLKVKAGDTVSANVLDNDEDPAGKKLQLVELVGIRGGSAKLLTKDGKVEFTASDKAAGDAGFSYKVTNGTDTSIGAVRVEVEGQNFPPTFQATTATLPAGGERVVDLTKLVTDRNLEDEHTFSKPKSSSDKLDVALAGGQLTIGAADDAKGTNATISLTVSDGSAEVQGTVTVEVTGHEGPPTQAVDDEAETTQGVQVTTNVTANDVDPLGEGLEVQVLSQQGGTATASGDSITFKPSADFFGVALVTYDITDASKEESRKSRATLRITVFGFPSKPSAPSITNAAPQSRLASLQWGVPAANGAPITGYGVQTDVGGKSQDFSGNKGDFTGLTNGTAYRFRVAARNKAVLKDGDLRWSDWSTAYTPDTIPGTPATPTLKSGDHSITVSWSPPTNEGTAVTGYTLSIGGAASERRAVGTNTTYTWTGLSNGEAYTFQVFATNKAGDGPASPWSAAGDPEATPAGKPFAPKSVTAARDDSDTSAGGNVKVSWQWDNTTEYDNGADAQKFTIVVSGGSGARTIDNIAATARTQLVSGLSNGTSYSFAVYATNRVGAGASASSTATPASVPGAPTALSASEGDGQAPLTYTAPNDGGSAITSYQIQSPQGSVGFTQGGGVSQGPTGTATGLTNGTTYTFQLRACNEVGCGPWSASSNAVTPYGNPAAPTVSVSVSNRTTLTWTWNAPSGNGRPIDHYEITLDGSLIDASYTSRSFSRSFDYSETHTLRVVAVNTAGLKSSAGSRSGTTEARPQSVTISKGTSAVGQSGCSHSSCAFIQVDTTGLGSGSHTYYCHSNTQGQWWGPSYASGSSFQTTCYYGYPRDKVWVVVDGVKSNEITW